ncbi:division/cell wall cluster transcriptional repressor MraZ [Andreprevotia chitinilytica]|uniref:division/cell wall cluster transcriptional repressor MraZ n=1 Tax=Andreprevotia chitinilytica TaxID=396808 RepID=UPI00054E64F0|nr:division/cell wall cluster transcriptional repressor MraZ [Andreprevotia chitinilytica]
MGVATLNLDSKGRLAIPAKHRELLSAKSAGRLVLTIDPAGCLLLYAEPDWLPVRDRLNQLSGAQTQLRRFVVGNAEELEMDAAGRILVPQRLRQLTGLEKTIAFVDIGNKFELWDETKWTEKDLSVLAITDEDREQLMEGVVL